MIIMVIMAAIIMIMLEYGPPEVPPELLPEFPELLPELFPEFPVL